jgi:hypothetical protein
MGATKTTLTAGGTGYVIAPEVIYTGFDAAGQQITEVGSSEVNGGSVVSISTPISSFASAPTISFRQAVRTQAMAYMNGFNTSFGTITSVYLDNSGSGYNPSAPPAVTVRDLRNQGTGAVIVAQTNLTGYLSGLQIVNGGSGYSSLGISFSNYANYPTGAQEFYSDYDSKINVRAGVTQTVNAYYGTGVHARGIQ